MRLAIMQPYFMPYAGYFRLMAAADLFVFYDCVQFPRRGWVHRNKLTHKSGAAEWLTLPLAKGERDSTRIMDLEWAEGAQVEWEKRMAEFPSLKGDFSLLATAKTLSGRPSEYIIHGLRMVCDVLGIKCDFAISSTLDLPDDLRAQDRILAIAEHYKATSYVNAPNGRELYDDVTFKQRGIMLSFLPDYRGKFASILERLLTEPAEAVAKEIRDNI